MAEVDHRLPKSHISHTNDTSIAARQDRRGCSKGPLPNFVRVIHVIICSYLTTINI